LGPRLEVACVQSLLVDAPIADAGILTEEQIRHVMALLHDPQSATNK
jgi:hypothetical protein